MLFTVSLASLVPFISAASLPVLHSDSPGSNHAIFQDLNTTSLTTSPVTPLSVTGLGLVHTQAHDPPPRYPPGYPGQPYDYLVRNSHIRIHCWQFEPDPLQNARYLDDLFARLLRKYSDPSLSSVHLWSEDNEYHWAEGDDRVGENTLSLTLPFAADRPDHNITYGEFTNVLIGFNHLRQDYPMLNIYTEIYREGFAREIGLMWLESLEPDEPEMTEEHVRNME